MKKYQLRKIQGSEFVEQAFWYILVIVAALGALGGISLAIQGALTDTSNFLDGTTPPPVGN